MPISLIPEAPRSARRGRQPKAEAPSGQVQSLTRGLAILEALAGFHSGLTLTELAAKIDLAPSTTHRLLSTLGQAGFVVQSGELGAWHIGVNAFRVGAAFAANRDVIGSAHPYLRRLMEQAGETANLAIVEGSEAVFIAQVQCREMMRMQVRLGARLPMHASGCGKAILAHLPPEILTQFFESSTLNAMTPKTYVTRETLQAELAAIRLRGYSFDDEENALGMRCVGAPILDEFGEPLGAISLAGPIARMTDARVQVLGGLIKHTAGEITALLGGRGSAKSPPKSPKIS